MDTLSLHRNNVDYAGIELRLLSVVINGEIISERCAPFLASEATLYSTICEECYAASGGGIISCGKPDIVVRRHKNTICWYTVDPSSREYTFRSRIWLFSRPEYEGASNGDTDLLPEFCSEEISAILCRSNVYPRAMGLYSIPDLVDDPQGRALLDSIQCVVNDGTLRVVDPPPQYTTIRVGIETTGVPECVVDIGSLDDACRIRFCENPGFPLWLTSDYVQSRMKHYLSYGLH